MQSVQIQPEGFLNPDAVVGQFGITPGMRIADFGCGAGHIGLLIAQRVGTEGRMTALDILEDKLDSIQVKAKAIGLENIDTVRANLEVLGSTKLADGSQDMAVLINMLFQSTKKADVLKEASRVLKPTGSVVVIEWKKGAGGFGPPDELRTSDGEMQAFFKEAGFSNGRQFDAGQFHYGFIFTR